VFPHGATAGLADVLLLPPFLCFVPLQSTTRVKPFICTMPMRLDEGWNQIQFNLSDFTRRAYGTNYIETLRVQIHANCRIRRIYFSDRLYGEEELPQEFKLFLPIQVRARARYDTTRGAARMHARGCRLLPTRQYTLLGRLPHRSLARLFLPRGLSATPQRTHTLSHAQTFVHAPHALRSVAPAEASRRRCCRRRGCNWTIGRQGGGRSNGRVRRRRTTARLRWRTGDGCVCRRVALVGARGCASSRCRLRHTAAVRASGVRIGGATTQQCFERIR
jgi:hypothetical protein